MSSPHIPRDYYDDKKENDYFSARVFGWCLMIGALILVLALIRG